MIKRRGHARGLSRVGLVLILATAAAGCALGLAAALRPDWLLRIDRPVSEWARGSSLEQFFLFWTQFGSQRDAIIGTVLIAAVVWRRCPPLAIVLPAGVLAGIVVDLTLKTIVDRPRPPEPVVGTALGSFPSGHALTGVVVFGLLPRVLLVLTRRRVVFWAAVPIAAAIAALVVASRVYLGAHWPSDVVASTLLGAAILLVAAQVLESTSGPHPGCALHEPGGTADQPSARRPGGRHRRGRPAVTGPPRRSDQRAP